MSNGFKPTGYGPKAGFHFPASFGFTGSTGAYTNVSPYMRQKPVVRAFKDGGYVNESVPDPGHATVQRSRPYTEEDRESGGRSPLRPGFKNGGKNWIKGAIKHPGAFKKKAKAAGMSTQAFASKVTKKGSTASATTKRQGALAQTLAKMHKADGGPVTGAALSDKDREYLMRQRAGFGQRLTDKESAQKQWQKIQKEPPAAGMKGKFAAADGGTVYGSSSKGFGSDVRKTGEFIGQIPRLLKEAAQGKFRNVQQDVADTKRRRIDSIVNADTVSNYARGGKTKRQMGGPMRVGYAPTMSRPLVQAMPRTSIPRTPMRGMMMRSKGGMSRYATGGKVMASRYAKGGMAHSDEAQDRRMIGTALKKHVNTPAPKGHKGLGKMCS